MVPETGNFFRLDFYDAKNPSAIIYEIIAKSRLRPYRMFEITEAAYMSLNDRAEEMIGRMRSLGVGLLLDDFGSGYSSLNMLKDISADVLKIDMGFLRASENEHKGRDKLESIVSLAGTLGMEVITEGFEKESHVNMLKDMVCNMFQGYFFSKPVQIKEFEDRYLI